MEDWAAAIQQLGAVRALKGSFFAYPIVSALHILGIGVLLTGVLLMDLRLLGAFKPLPQQEFGRLLRRVTLVGFALAVATGLTLFSVRATEYVALPLFWVKLGLIVVAGLNLTLFMVLDRRAAPGGALKLSGALSLALWLGVLLCGRFLGFVT
jgi:hypothetical protein